MRTTFKRKAFTLIELLIVIAIIGILFIVLVSRVDFASDKAKTTGVQTDFRSFKIAFETVAIENDGFNTLGWDTGDKNGNRVRDSVDIGDLNENGQLDNGETWTGRKKYIEDWTGIYTLINPSDTSDTSGLQALELEINKNLDQKLRITIRDDFTIIMSNAAADPWGTQYHGRYLSNSAIDGKDRGVIIMYSNGPNKQNGSADGVLGGMVNVESTGNIYGQDDICVATYYTSANGSGEVKTVIGGIEGVDAFKDASHVPTVSVGTPPTIPLPELSPEAGGAGGAGGGGGGVATLVPVKSDLHYYSWADIQVLARAKLSVSELSNTYNIQLGDKKQSNGYVYTLVDIDGNDYEGFVFMYNNGLKLSMNYSATNVGGYKSAVLAGHIEALYNSMIDTGLKAAIKQVTIECNSNDNMLNTYTCHLFLPSAREVGIDLPGGRYAEEGDMFDYLMSPSNRQAVGLTSSYWWLRTADSTANTEFYCVGTTGWQGHDTANNAYDLVPCFVIG